MTFPRIYLGTFWLIFFQKTILVIDDVIILEHWCYEILAVKKCQYFVCYYVVLVLGWPSCFIEYLMLQN